MFVKNYSNRLLLIIVAVFMLSAASPGIIRASGNEKECRDHPSFSRLRGYVPVTCIMKDSASFTFPVDQKLLQGFGDSCNLNGRFSSYDYKTAEGNPATPALLIFKSLEDSLRYTYGITVARKINLGDTNSFISGRIARDNFQTWVYITANGSGYHLTFIDKPNRVRFIPAEKIFSELMKKDTVTLDIFFDDDTSTVIPASLPVVEQLYLMLKDHPDLKISIQSHSDVRGYVTRNKIVSANRAKEVLDMMTTRGIEKKRLTSCGWGGDHPVADNRTEEGRALNRRIVIVRK